METDEDGSRSRGAAEFRRALADEQRIAQRLAVRTAELDFPPVVHHRRAVPVGLGTQLPHPRDVHQRGAMHPHETIRRQARREFAQWLVDAMHGLVRAPQTATETAPA